MEINIKDQLDPSIENLWRAVGVSVGDYQVAATLLVVVDDLNPATFLSTGENQTERTKSNSLISS